MSCAFIPIIAMTRSSIYSIRKDNWKNIEPDKVVEKKVINPTPLPIVDKESDPSKFPKPSER